MTLDPKLLELIVCPECLGNLELEAVSDTYALFCQKCKLVYPVRNNIPILLLDAAQKRE